MNITNLQNLPAPIVAAVRNDDYDKGDCDFSTTELISPVRIQVLKRKWGEHVTEDASDRIFSLFGQAMHAVLERAADPRYALVEKRYYWDCDMKGALMKASEHIEYGIRVGGRFDLMDYVLDTETNTLTDYKFTSHYAVNGGVKPEWSQQLNVNAFILKRNGFRIHKLQLTAIFRDWSKMRAARTKNYPQKGVQTFDVPIWEDEVTEQFIRDRIRAHVEGAENPPVCSPEERWNDGDQFAVVKDGAKRAINGGVKDSEAQAYALINELAGRFPAQSYHVEARPSEDKRCMFYCECAPFCDYAREMLQQKIA